LNSFSPLDKKMMELAFREAELAYQAGEVPIGAVIVKEERPIGRGRNAMESLKDPTAHAEMIAVTAACNSLGDWRLDGCTLYATLEPCPMCAGAILNSRIARVVFAARDHRLGACGSTMNILSENPINRSVVVEEGLMGEEGKLLLQQFFAEQRLKKRKQGKSQSIRE